jgi:GT2 family glycosyltransferase/glycosyltransferase involved in cell wall biosynthesis
LRVLRLLGNLALAGLASLVIWAVVGCVIVVGLLARLRPRRQQMTAPIEIRGDTEYLHDPESPIASVIVPNWDGRELLAECLPSVITDVTATPGHHEIIVVDNGSVDGSVAFLRENFPSVKVLDLPTNLGFIGGCNAGVHFACGQYVVLLNNDMKVAPGFLKTLLAGFQHPDIFAVTAQILFTDPTRRREETGKTYGDFAWGRLNLGHTIPDDRDLVNVPVFYAGGGSSAYNRAKFLALGGFDSVFHPFYVEDTDISYRAWKRGWPTVLAREAIVYHKHRATTGRHFSADFIRDTMDRNRILCYLKNVSDVRLLAKHGLCQPVLLLGSALRGRLNLRPWRLAVLSLPGLLARVWNQRRDECWSDGAILAMVNHPRLYREQFVPPTAPEPGVPLNVVFLSPYSMFPVSHGGAAFMYNIIKRLAVRHHVYVLTYVDPDDDTLRLRTGLESCGARVQSIVRRPAAPDYNRWRATPPGVGEFDTRDFRREVDRLLDGDVDILQIEYTQMAHYVAPSPCYVTVLSEIDVTFLSLRRRIKNRRWVRDKVVAWLEWLKMLNHELAVCGKFDLILTVTEHEKRLLQSYLPDSVISSAARTGVDVRAIVPRDQSAADSDAILFVGYFRHPPNVEAVLYLANEILPRVLLTRPNARLTIVGAHPPPAVLALGKRPGIIVTGFVEDVADYYRTHAILAAPILSGAGVRVKVLEAMAAGVPVVTSTLGAEGIHAAAGRELLIADDPAAFASALVDLLTDSERATRLARSARAVVEQEYDWDVIVGNLERLYYDTLRQKRRPALTTATLIGSPATVR